MEKYRIDQSKGIEWYAAIYDTNRLWWRTIRKINEKH